MLGGKPDVLQGVLCRDCNGEGTEGEKCQEGIRIQGIKHSTVPVSSYAALLVMDDLFCFVSL